MPIETTRIDDMPIVVSTYSGHISKEEVEQMYVDTEYLLADAEERYYRISDVTAAETDFADFMKISASMRQGGKFRTGDPNMQVVFVGTNKWIYNLRNVAAQKGIEMPAFPTMDEAMTYIHLDMERQAQQNAS